MSGSVPTSAPTTPRLGDEAPDRAGDPDRRPAPALLWRVFLANAAVLVVAALLLSLTPVTISAPIALAELLIVLAALGVLLAVNLVLLRRVLAPLQRLTETMRAVDPEHPGRRLRLSDRDREVAAVSDAFNAMLDRLERERRESARVALAAQEGERRRIAHELHDEIGQTLTAAAIRIERSAEGGKGEPDPELVEVADAVRESLDDVRRIARELRPEALDDLGLINALIALCSRLTAQSGLRIERRLVPVGSLDSDLELVVYRVAQESLTNVVRHARASRAVVDLAPGDGGAVLSVRDDGRGLPAEPPGRTAGIAGMRERARLAGGTLRIESAPGSGTTVHLKIPASLRDDARSA